MVKNKAEKRRLKRKAKRREKRQNTTQAIQRENKAIKRDFCYNTALGLLSTDLVEALAHIREGLRLDPKDVDLLMLMGDIGNTTSNRELEFEALEGLYKIGKITDDQRVSHLYIAVKLRHHVRSREIASDLLKRLTKMKVKKKRELRQSINYLLKSELPSYDKMSTANDEKTRHLDQQVQSPPSLPEKKKRPFTTKNPDAGKTATRTAELIPPDAVSEIPVQIRLDTSRFQDRLSDSTFSTPDDYQLTLEAFGLRFGESYERLLCLNRIRNIESFWYQEETARKVLKRFRGRALLADEVGLGKTIEALMVFAEYRRRRMIKNALILTPSPLVSQWRDELKGKFGLSIASTDDPDFKKQGAAFWREPFVLASINQAKSKNNYPLVTKREYDLVIVDEAHHLKNRNTLNWKLVNSLKKKYLLLLTATPVENNLMELYNLVTLLKPGLLKTTTAFREEFMTRGDATDPQNRQKLKALLAEVMIRNTRALAKLNIPPRYAQTIRVTPTSPETELYRRVDAVVVKMNAENGRKSKMLLMHLLAEAGSSPQAVKLTLERQLAKKTMPPDQEAEIRAIGNLCRGMDDTGKNLVMRNLIQKNGGKFLVFVKYTGTLAHICDFLDWHGISYARFHGGMQNAEKDEQVRRFAEEVDVMVTTEIGGEGRNLQFCHQMINYDLPWNPMKIEQRIGRLHRIGQKDEVHIYNLCNIGSVEDYILDILDKKINMFEMVIGEIDMILGRIRGDKDFPDLVYDIWVGDGNETVRKKSFNQLSARMKRSRASYMKTRELDEKLFDDNYEL